MYIHTDAGGPLTTSPKAEQLLSIVSRRTGAMSPEGEEEAG